MGRIKTMQVKRVTYDLFNRYGDQLTDSFEKNKLIEKLSDLNASLYLPLQRK